MNFSAFTSGAGFAAVGAGIMAVWGYIRTALGYITNIVIGRVIVKYEAGEAVMSFCFNKGIRSPLGLRVFGGTDMYVHPKRWSETVGYENMSSEPFVLRYKGQFALIGMTTDGGKGGGTARNIGSWDISNTMTISYIRGFFKAEAFVSEAIEYYNAQNRQNNGGPKISRFRVIRYSAEGRHESDESPEVASASGAAGRTPKSDGMVERMIMTGACRLLKWKREDLQMQPEDGQTPFTGYPFPDTVAEGISEIERWRANEKWFRSKSIPWRLGWLLYGPPGTGKSTLVRALGMTFNMPVYAFDLNGMANSEFSKRWDGVLSNTPCIALMEDFDTIFNGREYVGGKSIAKEHITFDCVLNNISGVKAADGVFLIVTTNKVESIDAALGIPDKKTGRSSRPGRIDRAIYLGIMKPPQREMLARHILADFPHLVEQTVKDGEGETPAQFQARCADLALSQFWKK